MVIYFLLRHDLLRYIILHSLLQAATHQYTMVNPMVCCQAAAGLHLLKGAHCTPVFSSSQFRPIRTMLCRGYLRCYSGQRESRDSRRGEGIMVHTNWL